MNETRAPTFTGGRNVAIKVPEHAFEATVAFYRDTLSLTQVYDAVGTKAFDFGPIRLWIDRMPHLRKAEMWLEVIAPDTEAAAQYLAECRCRALRRGREAAAGPGRVLDLEPGRYRASGLLRQKATSRPRRPRASSTRR